MTGEAPSRNWFWSGIRLPREGLYWALLAIFMVVVGWMKGINLVLLLGHVMLIILIVNAFWVLGRLRRLRVTRRFETPIFARTPFTVELEAQTTRRGGLIGLTLEAGGQEAGARSFLAHLPKNRTQRIRREFAVPQRGRYRFDPVRASMTYPFGLVQVQREVAGAESVLVLPALGRLHKGRLRRELLQFVPAIERVRRFSRRRPEAQTEFHGLRHFQTGDSPRWIHWRTSARRGELMVREFEEAPSDHLILVLEPWLPRYLRAIPGFGVRDDQRQTTQARARLEQAVSLAATICWEWCRQSGDSFVLAVAGLKPQVRAGYTCHDFALDLLELLAEQAGDPANDTGALLRLLDQTDLPPAPMLVVSSRGADDSDEGALEDILTANLHRPVSTITSARIGVSDFYEEPA